MHNTIPNEPAIWLHAESIDPVYACANFEDQFYYFSPFYDTYINLAILLTFLSRVHENVTGTYLKMDILYRNRSPLKFLRYLFLNSY